MHEANATGSKPEAGGGADDELRACGVRVTPQRHGRFLTKVAEVMGALDAVHVPQEPAKTEYDSDEEGVYAPDPTKWRRESLASVAGTSAAANRMAALELSRMLAGTQQGDKGETDGTDVGGGDEKECFIGRRRPVRPSKAPKAKAEAQAAFTQLAHAFHSRLTLEEENEDANEDGEEPPVRQGPKGGSECTPAFRKRARRPGRKARRPRGTLDDTEDNECDVQEA